jgi:hypothetical protein
MGVPYGFPLEWESGEPMTPERWSAHWPRDYWLDKIHEHATPRQRRAIRKAVEDDISRDAQQKNRLNNGSMNKKRRA